jgi:hypothetical protein
LVVELDDPLSEAFAGSELVDVPVFAPSRFSDPEPEPEPEPVSAPSLESEPEPELEAALPSADAAGVEERAVVLRSFFAQPLPLKWIVGAVNALRTGAAPQIGQLDGPSAVTEWMTSNRCPFGHR